MQFKILTAVIMGGCFAVPAQAHDYHHHHDHRGELGRLIISYVLGGPWCHEHRINHTHKQHYISYTRGHRGRHFDNAHYNYRDYDAYRHPPRHTERQKYRQHPHQRHQHYNRHHNDRHQYNDQHRSWRSQAKPNRHGSKHQANRGRQSNQRYSNHGGSYYRY